MGLHPLVRSVRRLLKEQTPQVTQRELAVRLGVDDSYMSRALSSRARMEAIEYERMKAAIAEIRAEKVAAGDNQTAPSGARG